MRILLFKIADDMVLAQRHRQTAEEEEELLKYLAFLRSRKPSS